MAFANTIKKRLLPFLLSGTVLAIGLTGCFSSRKIISKSPPPPANTTTVTATPAPVDSLLEAEIQRQLCLSNDKYTYEQAAVRAIANKNGAFNYPGRYKDLGWIFYFAAQTDYTADQVPEEAKDLWQNMQTLKNSNTIIGPALADFSVKANIFYSHANMTATAGLWTSSDGIVRITNVSYAQDYLLLTQCHETIHGMQTAN